MEVAYRLMQLIVQGRANFSSKHAATAIPPKNLCNANTVFHSTNRTSSGPMDTS